jgi:hypothetical protein
MNRRSAILAATTLGSGLPNSASAFLPLVFRVLMGVGVRGTATAGARVMSSRAVSMSVTRSGVTRTMQVVTTRNIGISLTGIVALSVTAAEVVSQYDVKAICVREIDKYATIVTDNVLINPTQLTVNIINAVSNAIEDTKPIYANAGKKEFEFDLPWETGRSVRRFEGFANSNRAVRPFSSGNILFTSSEDVVYERS